MSVRPILQWRSVVDRTGTGWPRLDGRLRLHCRHRPASSGAQLFGRQVFESPGVQTVCRSQYVCISAPVVTCKHEQFDKRSGRILKMFAEQCRHVRVYLLHGRGSSQRRRLAQERAQIVHQVDTPVTGTPGAYMRGYLVATVKHDNTLGIHLYGYLPTDKPVRHRVMHTIDGNGGILPGHGHGAAQSSPCHRGQAAAKPQYRPVRAPSSPARTCWKLPR